MRSLFLAVLVSYVVATEFRAVWIATVSNIDWPSRRDLTETQAKNELIAQLNLSQEMNMNAIVFQIRPAADAFYRSELEPWSYWLTGENGRDPGWDPMEFAVAECHKRALEIHVWLNPYRVNTPSGPSTLSPLSPANRYPDSTYRLEGNYLWMDPGREEVQNHNKDVIRDIVTRYDIDGLHYDDYFYPYPSYNNGKGIETLYKLKKTRRNYSDRILGRQKVVNYRDFSENSDLGDSFNKLNI